MAWQPTIDRTGSATAMVEEHSIRLRNDWMEVVLSTRTGEIMEIGLRGHQLLEKPAGVAIWDQSNGRRYEQSAGSVSGLRVSEEDLQYAEVSFTKTYGLDYRANFRLTVDRQALCWDVELFTNLSRREVSIEYSFPLLSRFQNIFWATGNAPFELSKVPATRITYREEWDLLPSATLYNTAYDYGLSLVGPFDLPKPGPSFEFARQLIYRNSHLLAGRNEPARAAVYVVAHEGDWRPALAWMLKTYPDYFMPAAAGVSASEGWRHLAWPWEDQESLMSSLASRGVTWTVLHGHFPFYGLYVPDTEKWDGILGIADSGGGSLDKWESGVQQGSTLSRALVRSLIDFWHRHNIGMYLYFQSAEAWIPYADKYYPDEIARDSSGNPYEAWSSCRLMNSDPSLAWGKHTVSQIKKLAETYREMDGIGLDRVDYRNYDYSHEDGVTMVEGRPCYMLGFALEQINAAIADILHPLLKGIWANNPSSIEVCRGVDGVMSESIQYWQAQQFAGLVRPMMYTPYPDAGPREIEEKLKLALSTGYAPNATDEPTAANLELEDKFRQMFSLLKGRKWVLSAHALSLPEGQKGNLFQTPAGDYVAVLVNTDRSQLSGEAADHNVPVRIRVPDAAQIEYCYALSGDYRGVIALEFASTGNDLETKLPVHLTSSMVVFSKEPRFNVVRASPPILARGEVNTVVLGIRSAHDTQADVRVEVRSSWATESTTLAMAPGEAKTFTIQLAVPSGATLGETDLHVSVDGREERMSALVVDAVQLGANRIFLTAPLGETVPLWVINNSGKTLSVRLDASGEDAEVKVKIPPTVRLRPYEDRTILADVVAPGHGGQLRITAQGDGVLVTDSFPFESAIFPSSEDLFYDDFKSGRMDKWQIATGDFLVANGAAEGNASRYLAIAGDAAWDDYAFQVTTRMEGSRDPAVGWLKSYVFFRVQGTETYYRFGIHGDCKWVDLDRRVNGMEVQLAQVPFEPEMNRWYVLKVEVRGRSIRCYIDGRLMISAQDDSIATGAIGIGVPEDSMVTYYKEIIAARLRDLSP